MLLDFCGDINVWLRDINGYVVGIVYYELRDFVCDIVRLFMVRWR